MPHPTYLVDTDRIIDHLCGIESVTQQLCELEHEGLDISVISLAERYEGAHDSRDPIRRKTSRQRFVAGVIVLPIDEEICNLFGKERGRIRKLGRPAGDCDLFIAWTAICHCLTLCTNTRRHVDILHG